MTEQKIKELETQIEALIKLKELAIKEEKYQLYDANNIHPTASMKILNAPDIGTFEYLINKYKPTNSELVNEMVYMNTIHLKKIGFANSLYLEGYISNYTPLLKLALELNDLDRLKMLVEVIEGKYFIGKKLKFCFDKVPLKYLTEYEVQKYSQLEDIDQSSFGHAEDDNKDDLKFSTNLMKTIMECANKNLRGDVVKFLLEKHSYLTGNLYEHGETNFVHMIYSYSQIGYDTCAGLPIGDLINKSHKNDFDWCVLNYIAFVITTSSNEIKFISEKVKLEDVVDFISYAMNQVMDVEFHKHVLSTYPMMLEYFMTPSCWIGVNLKNVHLEFFMYYIKLVQEHTAKYPNSEYAKNQNADVIVLAAYLMKNDRYSLVDCLMNMF